MKKSRCGYVAIIGRPNVGKSTLLNQLLGQKISITSRKPQTTRHRILGIKTKDNVQIIYVDTPGIHQRAHHALNRYMNRTAISALHDVDVVIFMVEGLKWLPDDELVLEKIKTVKSPVILVVNKVDLIKNKEALLPHLKVLNEKYNFASVLPLSATKATNVDRLESLIDKDLPENPHFFPDDQITDSSSRFLAAEIIREKLLRFTGEEVPYATTVEVEEFKKSGKILRISAVIWVEKSGQKAIIIGKEGLLLKKVGTQARLEMETIFESKVFLQVWVKVKKNWSDSERALQSLGYKEMR